MTTPPSLPWDSLLPLPTMPTPEESIARRKAQALDPLTAFKDSHPLIRVFNGYNLMHWISMFRAASLRHIPARTVYTTRVDTILDSCEDQLGRDPTRVRKEIQDLKPHLGNMLRWSHVAGLDLKIFVNADVNSRQDFNPRDLRLHCDDPRAIDLMYLYPEDLISVIERPWVTPAMNGAHPMEYRAYVEEGELVGISNYFPQRPLEINESVLTDVRHIVRSMNLLLSSMRLDRSLPYFHVGAPNSFTVDFLLPYWQESEQALTPRLTVLEAGPPFTLSSSSAHPCCFQECKGDNGAISVHGLALALGPKPFLNSTEFQELVKQAS